MTGVLQFFTPLHVTALWLCHIAVILWGIAYPFHARKTLDNRKSSNYLHLALLVVSFLLPATVTACTFSTGDYITRFPPVLCTSEEPIATYYFLILPLTVTCASGVSLLIIILTLLIMRRKVASHPCNTWKVALCTMQK